MVIKYLAKKQQIQVKNGGIIQTRENLSIWFMNHWFDSCYSCLLFHIATWGPVAMLWKAIKVTGLIPLLIHTLPP